MMNQRNQISINTLTNKSTNTSIKKTIPTLTKLVFFVLWSLLTIIYAFFSCAIFWCPWKQRIALILSWNRISLWLFRTLLKIEYQVSFTEHQDNQENFSFNSSQKNHLTDIQKHFANLPKNMLVIANHQSLWETIAFVPLFGKYFAFAFKKELLYIPFFGWGLALLRMIKIDRQKGNKSFNHLVTQAKVRLSENRPVLMFPQGTRIPYGTNISDKNCVKFKTGAARLAFSLNVPILAIHHDAGKLWPKKGLHSSGIIHVKVGPLFYPQNYANYQQFHEAACGWLIECDAISKK